MYVDIDVGHHAERAVGASFRRDHMQFVFIVHRWLKEKLFIIGSWLLGTTNNSSHSQNNTETAAKNNNVQRIGLL